MNSGGAGLDALGLGEGDVEMMQKLLFGNQQSAKEETNSKSKTTTTNSSSSSSLDTIDIMEAVKETMQPLKGKVEPMI